MNISELMYDLEERKLEVESVEDFYGGDNWELFMWLYDLSNE